MSKNFRDEVNAEIILQRMWEQCAREQFYDVMLIAGPEETRIPAHRSILCATSDYFGTMFTPPFNESTAREVKMPSADSEIVKTLVKYCYMRCIEIREDNVEKLLEAADLLRFGFVVNSCGDFLVEQLHPNNCFALTLLADRHNCESLLRKAKDYCLKHFMDFCKTDEFLELTAKQLGQLLSSDDLRVPCEEEVFKSVVTWLANNQFERERNIENLFKLIRMPLMKLSFLIDHVRPLCTSAACFQLYTEAIECHLSPERRTASRQSAKPRRYNQLLMAITDTDNKNNLLYYCPETLKWMKWPEVLVCCIGTSVAVMDDKLYIVGSIIGRIGASPVSCLDFGTMAVKEIARLNECRMFATSAVLKGFLYAVGGYNPSYLSSVERWDSISDTWNVVAPMSIERCKPGVTVFNDKLYVVGGNNAQGVLRSAECYDPDENVWVSIASMQEARRCPGLAVANGMLYAIGGVDVKTIERYNPDTDEWTMLCSLSEEIDGDSCTILDDKVMLLYSDRVEEYNPMTNECTTNASIKGLSAYRTFSYSGELLVEKFVEN